ncbi:MAG TPA: NAD-dependent epimerase/dehydratase family protein [Gammaproteobacteria bacterium]|nr:NAD-dependent epimerase/dehydratase family protein [Gammaproteobacteria bacterium]
MPGSRTVIVTGATSMAGVRVLSLFRKGGWQTIALSRRPPPASEDTVRWLGCDLAKTPLPDGLGSADAIVHMAGLPLLIPHLEELARCGVRRVVAIGTTSRFTKADSPDVHEREMVRRQTEAEKALAHICADHGMAWTLLRPTLIYDGVNDRNIAAIAAFARRLRFFPLVMPACGLRQPLYAGDLAEAVVKAIDEPRTFGRAYNLAGGETLTYREMVETVFAALGLRARLLPLPRRLLAAGLVLLSCLPRWQHVTPAMADRMNVDLVFDDGDARRDFGFMPRPFRPTIMSLLRAGKSAP